MLNMFINIIRAQMVLLEPTLEDESTLTPHWKETHQRWLSCREVLRDYYTIQR